MENEKAVTNQSPFSKEKEITSLVLFEKLEDLEKRLIQLADKLMKPLIS
ncbi:MAG: hypothetical protein ABIO79_16835 [Ferruginibacter sp.]